jgi:hypothetical protein
MGQFSAPNYELHDEQNDWSPNDEIEQEEPEEWDPPEDHTIDDYDPELYNGEHPF